MRRDIKKLLRPILFYGGFPFVRIACRRISKIRRIFIIFYHKVDNKASPFFGVAVRPEVFEKQICFLKKYYNIVDFSELDRFEEDNGACPRDLVVITFDDGYRNNYTRAFPILKKYNVPATIFLAAGYIGTCRLLWHDRLSWILYMAATVPDRKRLIRYGLPPEIVDAVERFFISGFPNRINALRVLAAILKGVESEGRKDALDRLAKVCNVTTWPSEKSRPMLSWEEVRDMSMHGISFGSHTMSHPVLSAIPISEVRKEIAESKKTIEGMIQKPVTTFAYPYGQDEDYTDEVSKILSDEGFRYACSTTAGHEQFPLDSPLALKRRGAPLSPYLFF